MLLVCVESEKNTTANLVKTPMNTYPWGDLISVVYTDNDVLDKLNSKMAAESSFYLLYRIMFT